MPIRDRILYRHDGLGIFTEFLAKLDGFTSVLQSTSSGSAR